MFDFVDGFSMAVGIISGLIAIWAAVTTVVAPGAHWKRGMLVLAAIGATGIVVFQAMEIRHRDDIAGKAIELSDARQMEYTNRGFVHATLAFLERHRAYLPDTYERAQQLCRQFQCDNPDANVDMVELSFALDGIVKGLAVTAR